MSIFYQYFDMTSCRVDDLDISSWRSSSETGRPHLAKQVRV